MIGEALFKENNMKRAIQLSKIIYNNFAGGGYFHIVLDDGNLEDYNIRFCVNEAFEELKDDDMFYVFQELGNIMLNMSEEEKISLYERYDEYCG